MKRLIEIFSKNKNYRIGSFVAIALVSQIIVFKIVQLDPIRLVERPEATQLLINTFREMLGKTTEQLGSCMTVVNACNENSKKVDAQIKAIFELKKEDFCD